MPDEHVVGFFGEHEARGARERIEGAFGERGELELAVAVGEKREHEKRQPIGRGLVECAENARVVAIARAPLEERFRFFAPVPAEIAMQQVDHRPQVPPLLHVHLEQVAQIVKRRRGRVQMALLLHRRRLGIALGDDDAPQVGAVLARHFLPRVLALVLAKTDLALRLARVEENSPAIVGHFHVIEMRPAVAIDADRGAQIRLPILGAFRSHLAPPVEEARLPALQRALQGPVARQVDVVGNALGVVDCAHALLQRIIARGLSAPPPAARESSPPPCDRRYRPPHRQSRTAARDSPGCV